MWSAQEEISKQFVSLKLLILWKFWLPLHFLLVMYTLSLHVVSDGVII
jgi:hypothetical protein